jgi:hypothetical protein
MNASLASTATPVHRGPDLLDMLVHALAARQREGSAGEQHLEGVVDHADLKRRERAWEDSFQSHCAGFGAWSTRNP